MTVTCLPCATGFHIECWEPDEDGNCHCIQNSAPIVIESTKERGGQIKEMADVGDLESTGRKRAAKMYPLRREEDCEWKGLKNAGGGAKPIVGCLAGKQEAIHHGPDKNTLANWVGNVHRICARCHNRWHTENDKLYPSIRPAGDNPYLPLSGETIAHDAVTTFTPIEFADNELEWANRKTRKNNTA